MTAQLLLWNPQRTEWSQRLTSSPEPSWLLAWRVTWGYQEAQHARHSYRKRTQTIAIVLQVELTTIIFLTVAVVDAILLHDSGCIRSFLHYSPNWKRLGIWPYNPLSQIVLPMGSINPSPDLFSIYLKSIFSHETQHKLIPTLIAFIQTTKRLTLCRVGPIERTWILLVKQWAKLKNKHEGRNVCTYPGFIVMNTPQLGFSLTSLPSNRNLVGQYSKTNVT